MEQVVRETESQISIGPDVRRNRRRFFGLLPPSDRLRQTPGAKKVIEHAMNEAQALNHNYLGSEHLLLGLARDRDGVAGKVLAGLDIELDPLRQDIVKLLGTAPV